MLKNDVEQAVKRGQKFLATNDLVGESSPSQTHWRPTERYPTTFVPSLVLNCLVKIPTAKKQCDKIAQELRKQASSNWSFNYWQRNSRAIKNFPYPDDLDDTFCALIGLYQHDPKMIDAVALAKIVKLLLATETSVGGPYRTWLADSKSAKTWRSVDVAVNANIAYFLRLIGSGSPPLLHYLESKILAHDYSSDYYPTAFPIWYYLARICPPACRDILREDINKSKPKNALQLALKINALRHLNTRNDILAKQLLRMQKSDGSWDAAAFCLDPSQDNHAFYHGSAALTTAFALEALAPRMPQKSMRTIKPPHIQTLIINSIKKDIYHLQPDLQHQMQLILQKIINNDTGHHITLLPQAFAESLNDPPVFSEDFFIQLGLANLYGWMAYTIYDDFLDEEGQPPALSAANVAMRSSLAAFRNALPFNPQFEHLVNTTFDIIDGANTWETIHCRSPQKLPHYGQRSKLAERSLGHTLTPLAVLIKAGSTPSDRVCVSVQRALRHYLIARQLDDDSHDWQNDLENGHMSYVVTELLRTTKGSDLQTTFWHKTLPRICKIMQQHIDLGRRELKTITALKSQNVITQLLDGVESSVQTTLSKQTEAVKFLHNYK